MKHPEKLIDLNTLPITFGGGAISGEGGGYGFGAMSEEDSISLLHYARERGITIFDTAPIYGFGTSEERIGKAFQKCREDVYIVSKSGIDWHANKRVNLDNSKETTERMLHESLKRLKTDYIDLYMIHWPDERFEIRGAMEILAKAKEVGKIRSIGLCNTYPEDLRKAEEVAPVDTLQSELNIFAAYARENLLPLCHLQNKAFMSWGTLDKGIISGRVTANRVFDNVDARTTAPWWKESKPEVRIKKMEQIFPYLDSINHTGTELALSYNLNYAKVTTAIVGAKSPDQIDSLLTSLRRPLEIKEIESALLLLS